MRSLIEKDTDDLPEGLQIIIIRVFAKDLAIEALEQDVRKFNQAIDDAIKTFKVAA